jgi:hypothetical protein
LGQLLDGFEGALAMQDPEAIARNFEALEQFLEMHDDAATGDAEEDDDESDIPF